MMKAKWNSSWSVAPPYVWFKEIETEDGTIFELISDAVVFVLRGESHDNPGNHIAGRKYFVFFPDGKFFTGWQTLHCEKFYSERDVSFWASFYDILIDISDIQAPPDGFSAIDREDAGSERFEE